MNLKEKFDINFKFVSEEDIEPLYSEQFGESYRFRKPIAIPSNPNFYLIPNHPNYAINSDGRVINLIRNFELKPFKHQVNDDPRGTYRKYTLGKVTEYRHRLLAIVFKEYHQHPSELHVNHIDGIKGNDDLDNIEWVTREENMEHARETGLINVTALPKPITAMNYISGRIIEFPSIEAASVETNIPRSTVGGRLAKPNTNKYPDGWRFKLVHEHWGVLNDRFCVAGNEVPVQSLNLRNGEITQYPTLTDASKLTGCNRNTIHSQCVMRVCQANNGFVFRYLTPDENFPKFNDLQLRLYAHSDFKDRQQPGCLLLTELGEEYGFGTMTEMWKLLGYNSNDGLLKAIRTNTTIRGMKPIYIDPNGIAP